MHCIAPCGSDEAADLLESACCQPTFAATPLDGKTISGFLIWTAELMAALMSKDPKLHWGRKLAKEARIEDEEAGVGGAVIVQLTVHYGRPTTAAQSPLIQRELPGGYDRSVTAHLGDVFLGSWSTLRSRRRRHGDEQYGETAL